MSFLSGSSTDTWHPVMTANTTMASYWLNWRFFLCAIWVLVMMTITWILIRKYEKGNKEEGESEANKQETEASLYEYEAWRPCLKGVHPAWLLIWRISAFTVLLVLLIVTIFVDGGSIFYYYTQWTITLVTIYFALGSVLSVGGCYQYHKSVSGDKVDNVEGDAEEGTCATHAHGESYNMSMEGKSSIPQQRFNVPQPASKWVYAFQIIFQMSAGAVMLTDSVFWFILVPFLAIKDYHLNALVASMHTINAIFLLGDAALNCLRFPWFRIAYFFTWTVTYVFFQWVLHACVQLWWPYPFLDLSSSYAPLWYFSVAVMHIPCYGVFAFVIKLKHSLFSRWFPESYQCLRVEKNNFRMRNIA